MHLHGESFEIIVELAYCVKVGLEVEFLDHLIEACKLQKCLDIWDLEGYECFEGCVGTSYMALSTPLATLCREGYLYAL